MSDFAHRIEEELKEAFPVKDEGALHRAVAMLSENIVDRPTYTRDIADLRGDVRVVAETMKQGFERVDKRFEDMNARFEQVDKRFEDVNARFEQVDKRFDDVNHRFEDVNRRFEDVNTRFEDMQHATDRRFEGIHSEMDRRFEHVDKRFNTMQWSIGAGFTLLVILMSVYEFIS